MSAARRCPEALIPVSFIIYFYRSSTTPPPHTHTHIHTHALPLPLQSTTDNPLAARRRAMCPVIKFPSHPLNVLAVSLSGHCHLRTSPKLPLNMLLPHDGAHIEEDICARLLPSRSSQTGSPLSSGPSPAAVVSAAFG